MAKEKENEIKYEEILFACYCRPLTKNEIKNDTGYARIYDKKNNKFKYFLKQGYLKESGVKPYHGRTCETYLTTSKIFLEKIEEQLKSIENYLNLSNYTLNDNEKKILDYFLEGSDKDDVNVLRSIIDLTGYAKKEKKIKKGKENFVSIDVFRKDIATIELILQVLCFISTYAFIDKKFSATKGGFSHNPRQFGEFKKRYEKAVKNSLSGKNITNDYNELAKTNKDSYTFIDKKFPFRTHYENINKKLCNMLIPFVRKDLDKLKAEIDDNYEKFKKTPICNITNILSFSFPIELLEKLSNISDVGYYPKIFFIQNFINTFNYLCIPEKTIGQLSDPIKSVLQEMKILERKIKKTR